MGGKIFTAINSNGLTKSMIMNNFTTTTEGYALDAVAGKWLYERFYPRTNEGVDGINHDVHIIHNDYTNTDEWGKVGLMILANTNGNGSYPAICLHRANSCEKVIFLDANNILKVKEQNGVEKRIAYADVEHCWLDFNSAAVTGGNQCWSVGRYFPYLKFGFIQGGAGFSWTGRGGSVAILRSTTVDTLRAQNAIVSSSFALGSHDQGGQGSYGSMEPNGVMSLNLNKTGVYGFGFLFYVN